MHEDAKNFLSTTLGAAALGAAGAGADPHPANVAGAILMGAMAGHATYQAIKSKREERREHLEAGIRGARNEAPFSEQIKWSDQIGQEQPKKAIAKAGKPKRPAGY